MKKHTVEEIVGILCETESMLDASKVMAMVQKFVEAIASWHPRPEQS